MLNFYIGTIILVVVTYLLGAFRLAIYLKKIGRKAKRMSFEEKLFSLFKIILILCFPLVNIVYGLTFLYIIIADDDGLNKFSKTIIKETEAI